MVNRKSTLPALNSSRLVDGVELSTTIQDAGCAWMTLVGESLHLLGLSLTVPLDALEAGERHVLGERREFIHISGADDVLRLAPQTREAFRASACWFTDGLEK